MQIIGLNPPFGVHAAIANVFVQHAVTFRPKLIVLIVPPETKRQFLRRKNIKLSVSSAHYMLRYNITGKSAAESVFFAS
jgi:hypothetical protein